MLFAKLRESVALFICPELRGLKALWAEDEAGYQEFAGSAVVVEADLGGFFDVAEAQAHAKARKEWIESEKLRLKQLGQRVSEVPCREVVVDQGVILAEPLGQALRGLQNVTGEARIDRCEPTDEARQDKLQYATFGGSAAQVLDLVGGHGFEHCSAPSVDVPCDASPISGGSE